MADIFDDLDTGDIFDQVSLESPSSSGDIFDQVSLSDVEPQDRTVLGTAGDIGLTALKGAIALPEAVVGLADMATGGHAGKFLKDTINYDPKESREFIDEFYSPAQKLANAKVSQADGFIGTAKTSIQNPSTIATAALESAPLMLGGAGIARGAVSAVPKIAAKAPMATHLIASALGEGTIGAGLAAEGTRQETDNKLLTGKQTAMAAASGVGTGIFNLVGGRLAQKLGFGDIDTMLVSGGIDKKAGNIAKRIVAGGISEGVFEEMPQSAQEQVWQNAALDKPLMDGVGAAAAQGALTGAAMGGGANLATGFMSPQNNDTQPDSPPETETEKFPVNEGIKETPSNEPEEPILKINQPETAEQLLPEEREDLANMLNQIATMDEAKLQEVSQDMEELTQQNPYMGKQVFAAIQSRYTELRPPVSQVPPQSPSPDEREGVGAMPEFDQTAPEGNSVKQQSNKIVEEEEVAAEQPADIVSESSKEAAQSEEVAEGQVGVEPWEMTREEHKRILGGSTWDTSFPKNWDLPESTRGVSTPFEEVTTRELAELDLVLSGEKPAALPDTSGDDIAAWKEEAKNRGLIVREYKDINGDIAAVAAKTEKAAGRVLDAKVGTEELGQALGARTHKEWIEQALAEGKTVPDRVLDGYSDLKNAQKNKKTEEQDNLKSTEQEKPEPEEITFAQGDDIAAIENEYGHHVAEKVKESWRRKKPITLTEAISRANNKLKKNEDKKNQSDTERDELGLTPLQYGSLEFLRKKKEVTPTGKNVIKNYDKLVEVGVAEKTDSGSYVPVSKESVIEKNAQ